MDEAIETVVITIAALRFARPFSINLGDEERADVRATAKTRTPDKINVEGEEGGS